MGNVRVVCKLWNDIVLSLPNTRLAFRQFDECFQDNDQELKDFKADPFYFFERCSILDARLARAITASCDTSDIQDPVEAIAYLYSFGAKLMHFCDKFSEIVQILDISIHSEHCLRYVYLALKNHLPNLKELRINCYIGALEARIDQPGALAPKPKLALFALICRLKEDTPFVTSLARRVIKASSNLREVTLPWGFHPDLSRSKCLDTLRIALDDIKGKDVVYFNGSELGRMLNQVADQLVTLSFGEDDESWDFLEPGTWNRMAFRFPRRMQRLKTYRNLMIDVLECTEILNDIEKMPVLETLVLGKSTATWSSCLVEILQNISKSGRILGT